MESGFLTCLQCRAVRKNNTMSLKSMVLDESNIHTGKGKKKERN